jgi:dihydrofolate synthase / folylpolyglutamate synthase
VIEEEARAILSPLFVIGKEIDVAQNSDGTFELELGDRTLKRVSLSLLGAHQGRNAVLAAKACSLFTPALSDAAIRTGLSRAEWPGRLEVFRGPPPVLLDGAHNAQGAEILAAALSTKREYFQGPLHVVFGVLADKDARAMVDAIAPLAASLILTRPGTPRARDPHELLAVLDSGLIAKASVIDAPADAMREATARARRDRGWVVVCGSLYLIGDLRAALPTE